MSDSIDSAGDDPVSTDNTDGFLTVSADRWVLWRYQASRKWAGLNPAQGCGSSRIGGYDDERRELDEKKEAVVNPYLREVVNRRGVITALSQWWRVNVRRKVLLLCAVRAAIYRVFPST